MPAIIPIAMVAGSAISGYMASRAANKAAELQAGASNKAAELQTTSANRAADIQGQTADKTLDFQKQQAAEDKARYEAAQRANYAQYLTHYNAVKGLGKSMGFDIPDAPDYTTALGSGGGSGASADPNDPAVAFIRKYQSENPATSSPADLVKAAKAAGVNISPYMYGNVPSNNEVTVNGQKFKIRGAEDTANPSWYYGGDDSGGGAGMMTPTTSQYLPSSVASYLPQGAPMAAPLQMPTLQRPQDFRLRGVGAYLGGRA